MANRYTARIRRVLDFHGGASKRAEAGDREAKQADVAMQLDTARYHRLAAQRLRDCSSQMLSDLYPGERSTMRASAERADEIAGNLERQALATIEREGLR